MSNTPVEPSSPMSAAIRASEAFNATPEEFDVITEEQDEELIAAREDSDDEDSPTHASLPLHMPKHIIPDSSPGSATSSAEPAVSRADAASNPSIPEDEFLITQRGPQGFTDPSMGAGSQSSSDSGLKTSGDTFISPSSPQPPPPASASASASPASPPVPLSRLLLSYDGKIFSVANPSIVIGRGDACDLRIRSDLQASGRHCRIINGQVEDLGSTNGTFHNGNRLAPRTPVTLAVGDVIHCGATTMTVKSADKPSDPASAAAAAAAGARVAPTSTSVLKPSSVQRLSSSSSSSSLLSSSPAPAPPHPTPSYGGPTRRYQAAQFAAMKQAAAERIAKGLSPDPVPETTGKDAVGAGVAGDKRVDSVNTVSTDNTKNNTSVADSTIRGATAPPAAAGTEDDELLVLPRLSIGTVDQLMSGLEQQRQQLTWNTDSSSSSAAATEAYNSRVRDVITSVYDELLSTRRREAVLRKRSKVRRGGLGLSAMNGMASVGGTGIDEDARVMVQELQREISALQFNLLYGENKGKKNGSDVETEEKREDSAVKPAAAAATDEGMSALLTQLREETMTLRKEKQTIEDILTEKDESLSRCLGELAAVKTELAIAVKAREDSQHSDEIAAAVEKANVLQLSLDETRTALKESQEALEKSVIALTESQTALEANNLHLAEAQARTTAAETKAIDAAAEADAARSTVQSVQGETDAVRADVAAAKARIDVLEQELEAARAGECKAKADAEAAAQDAVTANTQLEAVKAQIAAAGADDSSDNSATAAAATITGLEAKVSSLEGQLASAASYRSESDTRIEQLKLDLDKAVSSLSASEARCLALEKASSSQNTDIQALRAAMAESEAAATAMTAEVERFKLEASQRAAAVTELDNALKQQADLVDATKKALIEREAELAAAVSTATKASAAASTASPSNTPQAEAADSDVVALQTEVSRLTKDLAELRSQSSLLQSQADDAKTKVGQLEGQCSTLQQEAVAMVATHTTAEKTWKKKEEDIQTKLAKAVALSTSTAAASADSGSKSTHNASPATGGVSVGGVTLDAVTVGAIAAVLASAATFAVMRS